DIREGNDRRLAELIAPRLGIKGSQIDLLIKAMPELKARAHTLNQLAEGAEFLFATRPIEADSAAKALLDETGRSLLAAAHASLSALTDWNHDAFDVSIRVV